MSRQIVLRVDLKALSKTCRSKQNSGSPFKNWEIIATTDTGAEMFFRAPRYIWDALREGAWYDISLEKLCFTVNATSDWNWITSAESNGYRKKLILMESQNIPIDIGDIVLKYAFPTKYESKLVRSHTYI